MLPPSHEGRRRWGRVLIWLGILILCLWMGWLAFKTDRILAHARTIIPQIRQIQQLASAEGRAAALSLQGIESLHQTLVTLDSELGALSSEGTPFLEASGYLSWVPRYGPTIQIASYLLITAQEWAEVGVKLSALLQEVVQLQATGEDWLPAIARTLRNRQAELRLARESLARAARARKQIAGTSLFPEVTDGLVLLDRLEPLLAVGLRGGELAPALLGADGPRVYLILGQNEDELRPTGGFITIAGYLRVESGRITALEVRDSYKIDDLTKNYPRPPTPLYEYMGADMWLLRDANWSPDFPTSAEKAVELFQMGTGLQVDGVIALDQAALQYVLAELGPVEIPTDGGTDRLTADNLTEWMHRQWAPAPGQAQDGTWWFERKSFSTDLSQALRRVVERAQHFNEMALLKAVGRALDEKHILVYSREPGVADLLVDLGWDGRLDRASGDYLMVVEANVGFNKASPTIDRRLDYQIVLGADGGGTVSAGLLYRHQSKPRLDACDPTPRYDPVYVTMMDRCYWDYVRLVVPLSAELQSAPQDVVPGENLVRGRASRSAVDVETVNPARKSWGKLVLLRPGEALQLQYIYGLPAGLAQKEDERWHYHLLLQKQPGLRHLPVSVQISLPAGASVLHSDPQPSERAGQSVRYEFDLTRDQAVALDYALSD